MVLGVGELAVVEQLTSGLPEAVAVDGAFRLDEFSCGLVPEVAVERPRVAKWEGAQAPNRVALGLQVVAVAADQGGYASIRLEGLSIRANAGPFGVLLLDGDDVDDRTRFGCKRQVWQVDRGHRPGMDPHGTFGSDVLKLLSTMDVRPDQVDLLMPGRASG
ncbi:hypothetical protein GCM10010464_04220 [Pseudonocardia yunnanensis]